MVGASAGWDPPLAQLLHAAAGETAGHHLLGSYIRVTAHGLQLTTHSQLRGRALASRWPRAAPPEYPDITAQVHSPPAHAAGLGSRLGSQAKRGRGCTGNEIGQAKREDVVAPRVWRSLDFCLSDCARGSWPGK